VNCLVAIFRSFNSAFYRCSLFVTFYAFIFQEIQLYRSSTCTANYWHYLVYVSINWVDVRIADRPNYSPTLPSFCLVF